MATYEELKKKYPKMDDRFLKNHAVALKNRDAKDKKMEGYVSKAISAKHEALESKRSEKKEHKEK